MLKHIVNFYSKKQILLSDPNKNLDLGLSTKIIWGCDDVGEYADQRWSGGLHEGGGRGKVY